MSVSAHGFSVGQSVVYPAYGVGKITEVEKQVIDKTNLDFFVIFFEKENMKIKVPFNKTSSVGLRPLCSSEQMKQALQVLETPSKTRRMLWSHRAHMYEKKINSGDIVQIAEVVRDLFRLYGNCKQSYSERLIYQLALERLVGEYAAIEGLDEGSAFQYLEGVLQAA